MKSVVWIFLLSLAIAFSHGALATDCSDPEVTTIELDGTEISSLAAVHDQLSRHPLFPPYYGRNLDALFDVLTNLETPLQIRISEPSAAWRNWRDDFNRLLGTLTDAIGTLPAGRLCVLLR